MMFKNIVSISLSPAAIERRLPAALICESRWINGPRTIKLMQHWLLLQRGKVGTPHETFIAVPDALRYFGVIAEDDFLWAIQTSCWEVRGSQKVWICVHMRRCNTDRLRCGRIIPEVFVWPSDTELRRHVESAPNTPRHGPLGDGDGRRKKKFEQNWTNWICYPRRSGDIGTFSQE